MFFLACRRGLARAGPVEWPALPGTTTAIPRVPDGPQGGAGGAAKKLRVEARLGCAGGALAQPNPASSALMSVVPKCPLSEAARRHGGARPQMEPRGSCSARHRQRLGGASGSGRAALQEVLEGERCWGLDRTATLAQARPGREPRTFHREPGGLSQILNLCCASLRSTRRRQSTKPPSP